MSVIIEPTTDAEWVNSVLNDPAVRPWIADMGEGVIDMAAQLALPTVLALRGEHGVFVIYKYDTGIYEWHTAILPSGRGMWTRAFARAGLRYMFCSTDCVEVLTRIPQPHAAARKLALDNRFTLEFTTLSETRFRGEMVPIEVYSLSLRDWSLMVPELEQQGEAFHAWLSRQVGAGRGEPHANDPAHNRAVGIALAMLRGGQVLKALVWYNRAALTMRHTLVSLVSRDPVTIKFDAGFLQFGPDGALHYAVPN